MNNAFSDKLDPKIVSIILILGVIEFELFELGKNVVVMAGRDAWLSIIIGSVLVNITSYLFIKLVNRFPKQNFFSLSKMVWGNFLGFLLIFSYLGYWLFFNTLLLRNTVDVNHAFFLENTPLIIILLLFALGGIWLIVYGFPALTRFFQLMFPFFIVPLLVTVLLFLPLIRGGNFLPLLENGLWPIFKAALMYAGMLQGLELILFMGPLVTNTQKLLKPTLVGVNIINIFALVQSIGVIGLLGEKNVAELNLSGFALLQLTEIPGVPVERFELLLTLPLLIGLFTTFCLFLYLISSGFIQALSIKRYQKLIITLLTLLICGLTYLIPNYAWTIELRLYLNYFTIVFLFILPILTLLVAVIRGKGGINSAQK